MYSTGIDIGSVATKAVLYNGAIAGNIVIPTGWSPRESSRLALRMLLDGHGITREAVGSIVATGYGRVSADFADRVVTEITCHAQGAYFLNAGVRTVLDIGGQDSKVIRLDGQGNVIDFVMNDKCAAGTGRFLEVMARLIEADVQDLDELAANAEPQSITSMCTVFAESEAVSLLARGVPRQSIARGALEAVAGRVIALMGRIDVQPGIAFTGGLSRSRILGEILAMRLGTPLHVSPLSPIAGALGGAVIGWTARAAA
jgi:predicted CoA-substrate-specific enzyme activase